MIRNDAAKQTIFLWSWLWLLLLRSGKKMGTCTSETGLVPGMGDRNEPISFPSFVQSWIAPRALVQNEGALVWWYEYDEPPRRSTMARTESTPPSLVATPRGITSCCNSACFHSWTCPSSKPVTKVSQACASQFWIPAEFRTAEMLSNAQQIAKMKPPG